MGAATRRPLSMTGPAGEIGKLKHAGALEEVNVTLQYGSAIPVENVRQTGQVWSSSSPAMFAGKSQQRRLLCMNLVGSFDPSGCPGRPDATPKERDLSQPQSLSVDSFPNSKNENHSNLKKSLWNAL